MEFDTIAAVGTPAGEGGIGIIRISGPESVGILSQVFRGMNGSRRSSFESHRMYYGQAVTPEGAMVDQVMVVAMRSPRSYTGEDTAEIHCHGGMMVVRKLLELVLAHGARLAEPGEFTKRAFLNGKLDLAQAEAVADVIRSRTEQGLRVALQGLSGLVSERVHLLRDTLLSVLAHIEATIDFPEDDVDPLIVDEMRAKVENVLADVRRLVADSEKGKVYREGVTVVIVGRPNVGKSSLFNALVRESRAIVTEVPGTTRDVIEETIGIDGVPIRLMDTAGIRETADIVENEGVARAKELMERADLVVAVVDASEELTDEDVKILVAAGGDRCIVALNKSDLGTRVDADDIARIVSTGGIVSVSAVSEDGVADLEKAISRLIVGRGISAGELVISNVRHVAALKAAASYLVEAGRGIDQGIPLDLVSIDVKGALASLGEITGETVGEDVIDRIFSDFCIGK